MFTIRINTDNGRTPPGKLADAEIHFTAGPLAGLKLIGFTVWESRAKDGGLNVTFPARVYSVNGESRSFSLLRPIGDNPQAQDGVRQTIIDAYRLQVRAQAETPTK